MSGRPASFTESEVRRIIRAARKEGLRVIGVRVDGTILLDEGAGSNPLMTAEVPDPYLEWKREDEAEQAKLLARGSRRKPKP